MTEQPRQCGRCRKLSTDPVSHTYASGFLGYAHVERGEPAEAIPLLEHVIQELARFGLPQWHGMFAAWLAEAYRLVGEAAQAQTLAHRALEIAGGARYWFGVGHAQRVLGRIARSSGALPVSACDWPISPVTGGTGSERERISSPPAGRSSACASRATSIGPTGSRASSG